VAEYVVIARKYRPATFEQLVGQEHIARTLQNAIKQGKVPHALLFSGPRGVGKTTTARIFAKALNCVKGPTPTPCCKCAPCLEIPEGNCIDVIEIDGASNNSVDDIRLLRENARYAPSRDRYKIYIIDEVHMLTTQAFNALLKTLEEPPAHVKFVFATTAPERIPATILSRCQRYIFRRISRSEAVANLKKIAEAEGIEVDDEALAFIADKSSGSLRDAQSILDQARSIAAGRLTLKDVSRLLSVTDTAFLADFVDALIDSDPAGVIRGVENLFDQGVNFRSFFAELVAYFHKMLVSLSIPKGERLTFLELGAEESQRLIEQADRAGKNKLFTYLDKLLSIESEVTKSAIPRVAFEVAALGLCHLADVASVETLLAKLSEVQKSAGGSGQGLLEPVRSPSPKRASFLGNSQTGEKPTKMPTPRSASQSTSRPHAPVAQGEDRRFVPPEHRESAQRPVRTAPKPASNAKSSPKPENEALYNASNIPIVQEALRLFDGVIEDIKRSPEKPKPPGT